MVINGIELTQLKDYPNYWISRCGQVYSGYSKRFLILSAAGHLNKKYLIVTLSNKHKKGITCRIHRLVALTFIGFPEKGQQINHKNGVKFDNRIENLEWVSAKENIRHSIENKLAPLGELVYNTRLKNQEVLQIKEMLKLKIKIGGIAKRFNVSSAVISQIKRGVNWKSIY